MKLFIIALIVTILSLCESTSGLVIKKDWTLQTLFAHQKFQSIIPRVPLKEINPVDKLPVKVIKVVKNAPKSGQRLRSNLKFGGKRRRRGRKRGRRKPIKILGKRLPMPDFKLLFDKKYQDYLNSGKLIYGGRVAKGRPEGEVKAKRMKRPKYRKVLKDNIYNTKTEFPMSIMFGHAKNEVSVVETNDRKFITCDKCD